MGAVVRASSAAHASITACGVVPSCDTRTPILKSPTFLVCPPTPAGKVWIMGWIALDAVAHLSSLSPGAIAAGVIPARRLNEKFFVPTRYLLHASQAEMGTILDALDYFAS